VTSKKKGWSSTVYISTFISPVAEALSRAAIYSCSWVDLTLLRLHINQPRNAHGEKQKTECICTLFDKEKN
jgi:hypothetical protein